MKKSLTSSTVLRNGIEMPYLGLGTWKSRGGNCIRAVKYALNQGYTLIDTAQVYGNERQVGKGWKDSSIPRDEIFLTTKIQNSNQGYDSSKNSFYESLKYLQTKYIDLLLIHWPDIKNFERTIQTWQALIDLREAGLCRSIGVSNFTIPLIDHLINETNIVPAVNQVEFHTFLYQKELLAYCRENKIQIEAYSPIARAKFFDNYELKRIASKHEKSPAQVMLAWCIHHQLVVIPKTIHETRIKENADIFFELDDDDMKVLDNLGPEKRLVKGFWAPPSW